MDCNIYLFGLGLFIYLWYWIIVLRTIIVDVIIGEGSLTIVFVQNKSQYRSCNLLKEPSNIFQKRVFE